MENASKALIMAASVLLGVMILSIGAYLFYVYSNYSADAYQKMEDNQISEFNAQFLKYYGNTNRTYVDDRGNIQEIEGPILCTIHNIMSLANLAAQNNIQYGFIGEDDQSGYDENTYYIQIDIANKHGNITNRNLEKLNNDNKIQLLQANSNKQYICTDAIVSNATKRVCYMKFIEYEE